LKKQGIDISLVFAPLPAEERPLHSCYINKSWRELGIASIIIARRTGPGKLKFACFLIDRWGKGLKDVFGNIDFPEDKFKTEVIPMYGLSGQKLVPFDISMARKLVWSALEFTRKSGFSEPPDFKYWKDLPGILSDAERMEPVLAFDGQNFFLDEVADLVQESGGGKSKK
jgi:hypothetical protein